MKPEENSVNLESNPGSAKLSRTKRLALLCSLLAATVLVSCVSINRVVVAPPNIPGATFVGSETCTQCHENITKGFHTATHARLKAHGENSANVGCESCHVLAAFTANRAEPTTMCPESRRPASNATWTRGEFNPYHHPVLEGKINAATVTITGANGRGGGTADDRFDTCGRCHTAQRGPLFSNMKRPEGCTTCHALRSVISGC